MLKGGCGERERSGREEAWRLPDGRAGSFRTRLLTGSSRGDLVSINYEQTEYRHHHLAVCSYSAGSMAIPYQLSKEDAALFRQPTVERFRLSYVGFSAFETIDKAYFMHINLDVLVLEVCPCGS